MIIIPVLGRTRSSLIAGIFEASGAWVGSSMISHVRQYDTFENLDVIQYLQETFGNREQMSGLTARKAAPQLRKFVQSVVPEDRVICLKFIWYYHLLFRYAFPESDFYFVHRKNFSGHFLNARKKTGMFNKYRREMKSGTWIDSDRLIGMERDFTEIRSIIARYSSLKWNQQAVRTLYASCGDRKYSNLRRIVR